MVDGEQVDVPSYVWEHDEKLFGPMNSQTGFISRQKGIDGGL
jgi:hypothetical protein